MVFEALGLYIGYLFLPFCYGIPGGLGVVLR